jgi:SAM-dependent methyltransferase
MRFYDDLARWWPLISPPEEYAEEADFIAAVLRESAADVHDVLELGSGGGSNAVHLKKHFSMTLTDLSEPMLAVSRRLNPDCRHQQGDMRTLRLGETFDAVLVHDAVDYMLTDDDLLAAMRTAYEHCRPGGVAVFVPDNLAENFTPGADHSGADATDGSGARLLEWTWDPDPADSTITTEYVFVLRDAHGVVEVTHETHRTGLFSEAAWLRLLADAGFVAHSLLEATTEDRPPRTLFIGRR